MKILFYRHSQDSNFEAIISVIAKTKNQFGYASGEVNQEHLNSFAPDLIIHNIPDAKQFPIRSSAVSININETEGKNSFSFSNKSSLNYIGDFVHLKESDVEPKDIDRFTTDVVYIGSPSVFGKLLSYILDGKIKFKFFSHQPHNINGYSGMCNANDYYKFYKHSKACIVEKHDKIRIMDILAADGNPVVYNGSNAEDCIEQIKNSIANNMKYTVDGYDKNAIINKDTSYDRSAQIFRTIGLNKLADEIIKNKKTDWCKK